MSSESEILRVLERERLARKESERILETKSLEIYEQKLEIEKLRKELHEETNRKYLEISRTQRIQKEVFEAHPFSIFIYSLKSLKILNANNTAVREYGYSKEEFYKLLITDLHHDDDKKPVLDHIGLIKSGVNTTKVWTHLREDGSSASVKITGVSIEFENEQARVAVVEDITQRLLLEETNALQQKKYIDLIDKSSDLIFGMSPEGKFSFVNNVTCALTGFSESELQLKNFSELIRPDYEKRVVNFYKFQFESLTETTYSEFPIISKAGEEIWLGQNVNLSQNESGLTEISVIARVITERKVFEKALLRSEDKFRSIIENMELGLLETDRDGKIVKAYKSFCAIVGYSPEELEGNYGEFLLTDDSMEIMAKQQSNRRGGETGVYEIQLICKDQTKKWVMISGAPFYDQNNRFTGSIGIHLDISERKIIEAQLIEAKNIAEDSLRAKEVFLANISHEIRTPLNAVIGLSQILKTSELNEDQREMIKQVSLASNNLLNLINDILLLSKTEAMGLQLKPSLHGIKNTLEEIAIMCANGAKEKGVNFELELNFQEGYLHSFDKLRFTQVIQNLISNALKFTNEGYVKLSASNLIDVSDIEIIIEDSGIGIPEDELLTVFEDFTQAKNNNPEIYGGTGLGLSIVNNIIKLMDGSIQVERLNQGTRFTLSFKFPVEVHQTNQLINSELEYDSTKLEGLSVLVAEDNEVNQLLIGKILDSWGLKFEIAKDGQNAIKLMEDKDFDIVLMDIRMPIMNGLDATAIIRTNLKNYFIPIIALTANSIGDDKSEYLSMGFNDVLLKPFQQEDLFNMLVHFSINRNVELRKKLLAVSQGDLAFAETLRTIFIEDSLLRIANMNLAASEARRYDVGMIAHSMKPAIQQLGSQNLVELIKALEIEKFDDVSLLSAVRTFELSILMLVEELKSVIL